MYWWHDGWGGGLVMVALSVAFWAFVFWAVLVLVRANRGWTRPSAEDPERTLARRFAAGEIDEDEYRRRLEVLRSTPAGHGTPGGRVS